MNITVRELHSFAELEAVQEMQATVWGRHPLDIVPLGLSVAFVHAGGLLAGAFDGAAIVGFVMGIPTADASVQHSHMTAVLDSHRKSDAALLLKRFQRDWCLSRGIRKVVWTYDPIRGVNANFNVRKLGVTVRHYYPNHYGAMSGINAGVDSDRVLAEWDLNSMRTVRRIYSPEPEPEVSHIPTINMGLENNLNLTEAELLYHLPEDFTADALSNPQEAQRTRLAAREALMHYLQQGYVIAEFVRQGGNFYLLRRV